MQRVLIKWFGAVGDASRNDDGSIAGTDDTAATVRALEALSEVGGVLELEEGKEYRIDRPFLQLLRDTFGVQPADESDPNAPPSPARRITLTGGGAFLAPEPTG